MEMLDGQTDGCSSMVIALVIVSEKHAVLLVGGIFRSNSGNEMAAIGKLRGEVIIM